MSQLNKYRKELVRSKTVDVIKICYFLNEVADYLSLQEIGTHTLRKTFGYHFYMQYKDVAMLQEIFNHSSPDITLKYIGINQDGMDKAIKGFKI